MNAIKQIAISPSCKIIEVINVLENSHLQLALVVSEDEKLIGVVTDGDVRRGILKGIDLEQSVSEVMNTRPYTMLDSSTPSQILSVMKREQYRHMILVDENEKIVGVETLSDLLESELHDNAVIIMAGGFGSRLRPLTKKMPKPLLNVGGRPILETSIVNLVEQGFTKIFISINYKAEMISEYFGDGEKYGAEINYIHERKPLGTAGALSLIPNKLDKPFFVMNADILTNINFNRILEFHNEHQSSATMCVREYEHQIPYGVVDVDGHKFLSIIEKPQHNYFVNAGVYLLNPEVLTSVPKDTFLTMPDLFEDIHSTEQEVTVFPIREYWLDIGRIEDFTKANEEYDSIFE